LNEAAAEKSLPCAFVRQPARSSAAQPRCADDAERLDLTDTDAVQGVLTAVSTWNDRAQALLFDPDHLAPAFTEAEVLKPPPFNAYYSLQDMSPVDMAT
jgi:hypothetical protein